jgi:D-sedoheptulose 7-phosphate isomerase
MKNYYKNYTETINETLQNSVFTDSKQQVIHRDIGLEKLESLTAEVQNKGGRFLFIGNGASAAFASHMSLDWSKNGDVPCVPMFDLSHLTALGNDLGYDEVFSATVGWHCNENDVLITISSSGNSPNIIKAIEKAKEKKMKVVTFTGLKPDNKSRRMGDLNIFVPAKTYGIVECTHQVLLHMWLDHFMKIQEWDRDEFQNMRKDEFTL